MWNLISYFIRKNEFFEHIKIKISDLRKFKLLNHPQQNKLIIAIENGEIKILNIEKSNYLIKEDFSFDTHHSIKNVILNKNKFITLSREESEIRIREYQNETKKFNV